MDHNSLQEQLQRFEYKPGVQPQERAKTILNQSPKDDRVVKTNTKILNKSKKRRKRTYADPDKYAHLKPLTPLLQEGLRCVFIGFNPGTTTALRGHYYAHHSNSFWKLMYQSGIVDREVTYNDDVLLPDEYKIGFTDLVSRPTTGIDELSKEEMLQGVPELEEKISRFKPLTVCIVGKGIWDVIYRCQKGKAQRRSEFEWGLQIDQNFGGCQAIFVLPSTSGLVAGVPNARKLEVWQSVADYLHRNVPLVKKEA